MRASKTPFYVVAILAVTLTNCALAQTTISGAFCWGSGGGSSLTGGSSRVVVELGVPLTLSIYGGCALQSVSGHVSTITTTDIAATVAPPYVLTGSDFLPIDIGGVRYWNFSHTFSGAVIFRTPGPQTLAMTITGVD